MGKYASAVVKQAQAWLGLKESNGGHKEIINTYNSHKPLARNYKMTLSDPWCATFVSAVAIKLGYTDIIPTECSCTKMIEKLKKIGSFVENENRTPSPGDIIFYDWDDKANYKTTDDKNAPEHVGIVEKVENGNITVIEGNHDGSDADKIDGVERRVLPVNGRYIRGYGVPKYDAEAVKTPTKTPAKTETATTTKVDVEAIAKQILYGNNPYGDGETRKKNLKAKFGAATAKKIQDKVNELYNADKAKPIVHTCTNKDTLWGIAKKYLGNGSRYPEIMKLNGLTSTIIHAKQKLKIPTK